MHLGVWAKQDWWSVHCLPIRGLQWQMNNMPTCGQNWGMRVILHWSKQMPKVWGGTAGSFMGKCRKCVDGKYLTSLECVKCPEGEFSFAWQECTVDCREFTEHQLMCLSSRICGVTLADLNKKTIKFGYSVATLKNNLIFLSWLNLLIKGHLRIPIFFQSKLKF